VKETLLERAFQCPRLALTAMEAPRALGVSHDFFREHIANELRWVRRGRKKLVAVSELERWLGEHAALVLEDGRVSTTQGSRSTVTETLRTRKEAAN
jgi:hypothetical protein